MKRVSSKLLCFPLKTLADVASAAAFVEGALKKQGVKVKPRASANDGKFTAREDILDCLFGVFGIVGAGIGAHRVNKINRVMRHAGKLLGGWLCGADIHFAIDLHRVAAYYLSAQSLGKRDCKTRFSRGGVPDNGNYLWLAHFFIGLFAAAEKSSGYLLSLPKSFFFGIETSSVGT